MRYEFLCDECELIYEVQASIRDGPPEVICEECEQKCHQNYGCNFILKGNGWPSKDIHKGDYLAKQEREKEEGEQQDKDRKQRIVNEVMSVRRQGRKAKRQFKKDNPQKYHEYEKAMTEGIKADKK
jgi:predicted nucleic acid-binding Zn ribbon protein